MQKSAVKSFTLTEPQYERLKERRPDLIANAGELTVLGYPQRDRLMIHYAFPEVEAFRDNFSPLFDHVIAESGREEAPRGVLLSFRDRPNRSLANTIFWALALEEGRQWVEMNLFSIPEQEEPPSAVGEGFQVREATEADGAAIAAIESEVTGEAPLTKAGVKSLYEDARWLRIVTDGSGIPAAYVALRTEPGGWGVIEDLRIGPAIADALRRPLVEWTIAFLRSNGVRRVRQLLYVDDDAAGLALLRELGFTAGETGLDYTRSVDRAEVSSIIEERRAHGTLIKFGDWR
jgi:hypothetical protein